MALGDVSVEDAERLARMILVEKHLRRDALTGEVTAKPDAFLPHSRVELSVIRHREITETELWAIGREVSAQREAFDLSGRKFPLLGRGDFLAGDARAQNLDVVPAEGPTLPRNHADIIGWPPEKPAQMRHAVRIAAASAFVAAPSAV